MKIRDGRMEDLDFFKFGLEQVRTIENRPESDIPVTDEDVASMVSGINNKTIRVIGDENGDPAGFIYYRTDFPIMYVSGKIFWIDLLFVREKKRGKGHGKALYQDVIRIARESGSERIVIDIFDRNHRSKIFHDNLGFKPIYAIYGKDI